MTPNKVLTPSQLTRVRKLMKDILEYKRRYYTDGTSPVSDEIYDLFERRLEALDPQNPLVHMVGYDDRYVIPKGYKPDPDVVFTADGIFKNNQPIARNDVGNPKV